MFKKRRKVEQSLKATLERFDSLVKELAAIEEGTLRFKSRLLSVSEIAAQYYCEKKVELSHIRGEEETPEMREGKVAHELLLKDAVKAEREEILRRIFSGKPTLVREMPLLGKYNNVIIAGVADALLFYQGSPILLVEHKFTGKPIPFRDHHVQASLYCHLLDLMGWDVSQMKYALVIARPECRNDKKLIDIPRYIVRHLGEDPPRFKLEAGSANIYINNYDSRKTVADLDWALNFWIGKRPAVPTRKSGKCVVCSHNGVCEFSLSKRSIETRLAA